MILEWDFRMERTTVVPLTTPLSACTGEQLATCTRGSGKDQERTRAVTPIPPLSRYQDVSHHITRVRRTHNAPRAFLF